MQLLYLAFFAAVASARFQRALVEDLVAEEGSGIRLYDVVDDLIAEQAGRQRRDADTDATETTETTTTTTAAPATSTTAAPATNSTLECKAVAPCSDNDDCNGGTCLGYFPGKCNCQACIHFFPCKNDTNCGGLEGACNNKTKACDCFKAFTTAGYKSYGEALTKMCNVKTCKANECNGLSCHKGFCQCPLKKVATKN